MLQGRGKCARREDDALLEEHIKLNIDCLDNQRRLLEDLDFTQLEVRSSSSSLQKYLPIRVYTVYNSTLNKLLL